METPSTTPQQGTRSPRRHPAWVQRVVPGTGDIEIAQADPAGEHTIAARRDPQIGDMVRVEQDHGLGVRGAIARVIGHGPTYGPVIEAAGQFYGLHAEDVTVVTYDRDNGWTPVETAVATPPQCDEPHLGLATTRQLLDEIAARIEMDYYSGGGGLDYTTVKGRP